MDRGAWWATWDCERVGHDLATQQQLYIEKKETGLENPVTRRERTGSRRRPDDQGLLASQCKGWTLLCLSILSPLCLPPSLFPAFWDPRTNACHILGT